MCEGKVCGCDEGMWVWRMCECEEESVMQYAQGISPLQYYINTSNKCVKGSGGGCMKGGANPMTPCHCTTWCVGRA